MYDESPQYYTSPPGLDYDPQSRGSSSSTHISSPSQQVGGLNWLSQQLYPFDGQQSSANEYDKSSIQPGTNNIVANDGPLYGMPGQMPVYQPQGLENQAIGTHHHYKSSLPHSDLEPKIRRLWFPQISLHFTFFASRTKLTSQTWE